MNTVELAGRLAAGLTFGTFACCDMARLRPLAVMANLPFIAQGAGAGPGPVFALHLVLLPVNPRRVVEPQRAPRAVRPRAVAAQPGAARPSATGAPARCERM